MAPTPSRIAPRAGAATGVRDLTVAAYDDSHALGAWRQILITVWRTETRPSAVAHASKVLSELVAEHRDVGILQVVEAGASAPETDARRAISDMLRRHGEAIRCSAVVFEGDGFRAATLRAVVTGITLLSRPPYPHVVFSSSVGAVNWTAQHFSQHAPSWVEQALAAVAGVRQVITTTSPSRDASHSAG